MTERTWFETIKVEGGQLVDQIGQLIREGNARRIVIRQNGTIIVEFPLTVGVVGTMIAPIAAAIGALAALLADCQLEVERGEPAQPAEQPETPAETEVDEVFELMER